jgi:hypothetical protein
MWHLWQLGQICSSFHTPFTPLSSAAKLASRQSWQWKRGRTNTPAQFSDLQPGVAVAVWGEPGEDLWMRVARVIVILTK